MITEHIQFIAENDPPNNHQINQATVAHKKHRRKVILVGALVGIGYVLLLVLVVYAYLKYTGALGETIQSLLALLCVTVPISLLAQSIIKTMRMLGRFDEISAALKPIRSGPGWMALDLSSWRMQSEVVNRYLTKIPSQQRDVLIADYQAIKRFCEDNNVPLGSDEPIVTSNPTSDTVKLEPSPRRKISID
jgi:hypothetical protein